jgi:lactate dehydrogenase-like 2-hydroxyacid dehydrogenase
MRVLITRLLPDAVLAAARARFDVTLREEPRPMAEEESIAALQDFDAILPTLGDAFGTAVFDAVDAPRCGLLANFGVGYNHIDAVAAKAKGIAVTNTPGAVTDATADIAMMLILMSARRASGGERLVRAGQWTGWHPVQMLGQHVTGKTLAVIGMGRIGKAIARRAHFGFGMRIVFFNRSPVANAGMPATQVGTVAEAMAAGDFVVTAVPGGPATRHIVDAAALAAMRSHAHLVNIARGDVVDEAALIAALTEHRIAGAGLDVYEREPVVPDSLRALDNVTLLPHLGTATLEVRTAMGMMAVENLIAFTEGRALINPV